MSHFVYSAGSGQNDPMFGKFIAPIKMLIENEANNQEKNKTILDVLFNIEKSNQYAETIMGQSEFGLFQGKDEGQGADNDSVQKTFDKIIEHVEFGKEFTITRKMLDDSKFGIAANTKSAARGFTQAYYRTRVRLAAQALINGIYTNMVFNKARVNLAVGDGQPLFSSQHKYWKEEFKGKYQTNYYYGDLTSSQDKFEEALSVAANNLRNVEDENGESMNYTADILIIPANRPKLERMAKAAVGSERTTGNNFNDINVNFGGWTLVVLDGWRTDDDRFMVMSSEANKNLLGNVFFNRVPLDIKDGIDPHTRSLFFNGYCRFGVGFGSWKHIALYVNSTNAVSGATKVA